MADSFMLSASEILRPRNAMLHWAGWPTISKVRSTQARTFAHFGIRTSLYMRRGWGRHRQSGSQLVKQQAFECKLHCTKQSGHARIILSITVSALEDPFTGNKTIFHEDLAFGDLGNIWFVGHHQNRASLGIQILQNCHDL